MQKKFTKQTYKHDNWLTNNGIERSMITREVFTDTIEIICSVSVKFFVLHL